MSASGGTSPSATTVGGAAGDLVATSGNVAAGVASAVLAAAAGKVTYLAGFTVTAGGATAASVVDVTVVGPAVTLHYSFAIPAGATLGALPLTVEFERPIPAAAANTAITVSCPSAGAGNTNTAVNAHGFQQ